MTKEWRTIDGLQADKDWLQQENDRLRAGLLKAPNAQMVALIAEFELWMEAEDKQNRECYAIEPNGQSRGQLSQSIDTMIAWSELKAKHLPEKETT